MAAQSNGILRFGSVHKPSSLHWCPWSYRKSTSFSGSVSKDCHSSTGASVRLVANSQGDLPPGGRNPSLALKGRSFVRSLAAWSSSRFSSATTRGDSAGDEDGDQGNNNGS